MKDERSAMAKLTLPDWLCQCLRHAFLGEIYSNIRAIAIGYRNNEVTIRFYLDREPTNFDNEVIEVVSTNFDSLEKNEEIKKIHTKCIFFKGLISEMDPLDGFFYARREIQG